MKGKITLPQWRRVGLGAGAGMLAVLAAAGGLAALMEREVMPLEWMNYGAVIILVAASFLGAALAGEWVNALCAGGVIWLCLLVINAIVFEGAMAGAGPVLLAVMAGCGAAILLGLRGQGRHNARRRKYRIR